MKKTRNDRGGFACPEICELGLENREMWFHIRIFAQVLAAMFLPFLLIAGLTRIFLPQAKAWRLSLLGVLVALFVDLHLHFFLNPVRIDRLVADSLHAGPLEQFGTIAEALFIAMSFAAMLFGSIMIPLLFARGGIAIVDGLRKWRSPNHTSEGIHQPADEAPRGR